MIECSWGRWTGWCSGRLRFFSNLGHDWARAWGVTKPMLVWLSWNQRRCVVWLFGRHVDNVTHSFSQKNKNKNVTYSHNTRHKIARSKKSRMIKEIIYLLVSRFVNDRECLFLVTKMKSLSSLKKKKREKNQRNESCNVFNR